MKQNILFLSLVCIMLLGCRADNAAPVEYTACDDCDEITVAADCADTMGIRYSMPNGNDLVLETPRHIIQIDAQPGINYDYYVWTGDRSYDDDPDLIVQDGIAAVLVAE